MGHNNRSRKPRRRRRKTNWGFVDGQKFVGEINAYGVRVEDNRDYPVACSLNLELTPEKVVNAKKRTIKKEDLNSIKILLKDGLITQKQFDALKKKIENKDKPAAKKPYDPDLEKKIRVNCRFI